MTAMHRTELELQVVWRHRWAHGLDFVRECYCWRTITLPRGAVLIAYVQSGKSYRCYFLLSPQGRKLDGIGQPRSGIGRPVAPYSIHPRGQCAGPLKPRRIAAHVRHELQAAFGVKSNWSLKSWLRFRHCVAMSWTWLFRAAATLLSTIGGLAWRCLTSPMRLLSAACRSARC